MSLHVLSAHNTYQLAGGEDVAVERERALLGAAGHRITPYLVDNASIRSLGDKARTFLDTPYSANVKRHFRAAIEAAKPDVVHIHNFFPLLTTSAHEAAYEAGVGVVQTLHNYRTVCAGAVMMRDGRTCDKCVGASPYWGVLHGCYRNSALASLAVVRMNTGAHRRGTWARHTDRIIALSEYARGVFIRAGFPEDRVVVNPLFAEPVEPHDTPREHSALFVGRLSEEKGAHILLKAWETLPDIPLRVVGDGPLADRLKAQAPGHVVFLGRLDRTGVQAEMRRAAFQIMPSICNEMVGTVIIEGYAAGLPSITARVGGPAEFVRDGETGLHFESGNARDLADKVRWAATHPDAMSGMGRAGHALYQQRFTAQTHLATLERIYAEAVAAAASREPCVT